ncbi:MarR family transcriptional regulator [Nocardioides KLBMP 9356]|uniref:MarR family transcriptional regulator n=1 Tax=Nocardioides potassii TaxID=2911371 RepID=A0ABS9HE62_9ACTN|nr:MarR family transcriptional regulator [Nocardioides potassii]MCF6378396.1 MarR family transcriptional regulator [Nocardioides potassii]
MPSDQQPNPGAVPGGPPAGWEETPTLEALRHLVLAGGRVNHVVARRAGMSLTELATLEHLTREQIGPAEVARRLEVSTAAATGIVDRLVSHGHVERQPHPDDRRRTQLVLTASGRREVVGQLLPMFVALDRLDGQFTDEEKAVVERYLRGATEAFEQVTGPEPV